MLPRFHASSPTRGTEVRQETRLNETTHKFGLTDDIATSFGGETAIKDRESRVSIGVMERLDGRDRVAVSAWVGLSRSALVNFPGKASADNSRTTALSSHFKKEEREALTLADKRLPRGAFSPHKAFTMPGGC